MDTDTRSCGTAQEREKREYEKLIKQLLKKALEIETKNNEKAVLVIEEVMVMVMLSLDHKTKQIFSHYCHNHQTRFTKM